MGLYIGIDLVTSSVKLMLTDGDGNIKIRSHKNTLYPIPIQAGASKRHLIGGMRYATVFHSCF